MPSSLIKKLSSRNFSNTDNPKRICFDVVALFTNTPINLAIKYLDSHYKSLTLPIPKNTLIHLINFVCYNSFFVFNDMVCRLYGCTMGSLLSLIIADWL